MAHEHDGTALNRSLEDRLAEAFEFAMNRYIDRVLGGEWPEDAKKASKAVASSIGVLEVINEHNRVVRGLIISLNTEIAKLNTQLADRPLTTDRVNSMLNGVATRMRNSAAMLAETVDDQPTELSEAIREIPIAQVIAGATKC